MVTLVVPSIAPSAPSHHRLDEALAQVGQYTYATIVNVVAVGVPVSVHVISKSVDVIAVIAPESFSSGHT